MFRHCCSVFEEKPVVPAMFLIHERNLGGGNPAKVMRIRRNTLKLNKWKIRNRRNFPISRNTLQRNTEQAEHRHHAEHHTEQKEYPEQAETCIDVEEMNESLEKDIHYSKEVWIPADRKVLFENLNVLDRELIIDPCGWLNGTLIDSAMEISSSSSPTWQAFSHRHWL